MQKILCGVVEFPIQYQNPNNPWISNRGLGSAVQLSNFDMNSWQKEVVHTKEGF